MQITFIPEDSKCSSSNLLHASCGLVALCMAAELLRASEKSPDAVLTAARQMGYTLHGEMFSGMHWIYLL